ncbi:MAG TPA: hypothetical protein VF138_01160 [Caulobacteraceae bacterium]
MFDEDLRQRVGRLLRGERRTVDLDRLYLGLRSRSRTHHTFREVGDFVAHRDTRDKGLLSQTTRDVFTSFDVWSLGLRGKQPSLADIERASAANLRLATDEQLKQGCGCGRATARKRLAAALEKAGQGHFLTAAETRVLQYLGNHFIWKPAFTGEQLFDDFAAVLVLNQLVDAHDRAALQSLKAFVVLHALTVMHGSSLVLESGSQARLLGGYANKDRWLEVKVELTMPDFPKPVWAPISMFYAEIQPEDHCDPSLILEEDPVFIDHWNFPLEVGSNGRLTRVLS